MESGSPFFKWSGCDGASSSGSGPSAPTAPIIPTPSGRHARRHGKGVVSGEGEGGEGRWCLAADVLEKIFSLLPMQDVIRSGAVCRWWHSVVSAPVFRNGSCSSLVEGDIYFPVFFSDFHQQSCFGFDIDSKKWRELPPITFLPADQGHEPCELLAYDKGLVCMEKAGLHYVCNPSTKAYRVLPPMICCKSEHGKREHAVDLHLQVDRDGEGYTLIALCGSLITATAGGGAALWFPGHAMQQHGGGMNQQLGMLQHRALLRRILQHPGGGWLRPAVAKVTCYDSRTNVWTPLPATAAPHGCIVVSRSLFFRGVLYVLAQERDAIILLMGYDVEGRVWIRFGPVHSFKQGSKTRLVAVGDHVMVVSLNSKGFLVSSLKPPPVREMNDRQVYYVQSHELFLEEGSEFVRDCHEEGWDCVGYQSSIYIVTLRSLKLSVCHVFKRTWLRLQSGSLHCARRTYQATPFSCPIEVGLRTPV